jgi:ATP-dependent helicase/nuclease subunit A
MSNLKARDQHARQRILHDLDTNFLVEAGAGSGKTTSLVGRMLALVRRGVAVERIAAVTFTRKAAGELRERFQVELELAAATTPDPLLDTALRDLDNSFLGTIHAFCGRLLRERALEAGLVPTFEELDPEQFTLLQTEFWGHWLERCRLQDDSSLARLAGLGIPPAQLTEGFNQLVQNPDVSFSANETPAPDHRACRTQLDHLLAEADKQMPAEEPEAGWDALQGLVRWIQYLMSVDGLDTAAGFGEALAGITETACKPTQNRWGETTEERRAAKALGLAWEEFRAGAVKEYLGQWYAHRYAPALGFLESAARAFSDERVRRGLLGFQDLLSHAARLLRESDSARLALGRRYERLLVDEFQDTDPIQAEVCLLLASDPSEGNDWRKVAPRPGSLFVVGDPKQSIYRFRRADLETYRAVQEQLARSGEVLHLTQNFRSTKPIEKFVNAHFEAAFPATPAAAAAAGQAAFAPMQTERPAGKSDGIYWYPVSMGDQSVGRASVLSVEAPRLARWIADRIASGERKPEDFMVLTYQTAAVRPLAEALALRNVPVETSGADIPEERELGDLLLTLRLLADPGNPVLVVAVLEGLFFGLSPADLFEAREAGIEFTVVQPPAREDIAVGVALGKLRSWLESARRLPPDLVLERILDETGLLLYAAGLPLGDARAGLFVHLLGAVRRAADAGSGDLRAAIAVIESHLASPDTTASLRPGRGRAVRVMNLHKAKGLEAEVVVLACPSDLATYAPGIHVRRDQRGAIGFLSISDSKGNVVARPVDWEKLEEREVAFLASEQERLRYVAATRARSELVVSRLDKMNKDGPKADRSMWAPLAAVLNGQGKKLDLRPDVPPGRAVLESAAVEAALAAANVEQRLLHAAVLSETATSVTRSTKEVREEALELEAPRTRGGDGKAWGSAVHRAIEAMGRGRSGEGLKRFVRAVARDEGLGITEAEIVAAGERLLGVLERVQALPEWQALAAAPERRFEWRVARVTEAAEGRLLTEGVIDAAALVDGSWQVFDWKTDADGAGWESRRQGYEAQVARYAEILFELGQPAGAGRVVRVGGSFAGLPVEPRGNFRTSEPTHE